MSNPARKPPSRPRSLAGIAEIAQIAGVTKQRANQMADNVGFPPPVDELRAGRVWNRQLVERYVAATRRSDSAAA